MSNLSDGLYRPVRSAPSKVRLTTDALAQTLTNAESLVFNRASTGLSFENLLKMMSLYDTLAERVTRYDDGASPARTLFVAADIEP